MVRNEKILIVGGGIAGLAVAGALQRAGWSPRLVEIKPEWPRAGTGLYTPANGVAALEQLGLAEAVRSRGFAVGRRHIATANGAMLLDLDLESVWGQPQPCLGIHREALHEVLVEGAHGVDLALGTTVTRFEAGPDGVDVALSDGSDGRFDLVVGADGIRSSVRAALMGEIELRIVNPLTCRFVTTRPPELQHWTLRASALGQFLMIPISDTELYCYVARNPQAGAHPDQAEFFDPFKHFADPVPAILAGWSEQRAHWSRLEELALLPTWGRGRVVLIGDAAHAMPPFMAQGGALALEDAVVLSALLQDADWSAVAESLTVRRRERVDWVRARSQRREKLARLPFWIARLGLKLSGKKAWTQDYAPLRSSV